MRKQRHNYTPEEKVAILKRHLVERVPVSDLCDQYHLQPTVFYHWQQQFFEKGAAAFTQGKDPKRKETQRIEQLEEKLRKKHEVLSELMEEHVKLKKELGEL
jgi:transposase-like protein